MTAITHHTLCQRKLNWILFCFHLFATEGTNPGHNHNIFIFEPITKTLKLLRHLVKVKRSVKDLNPNNTALFQSFYFKTNIEDTVGSLREKLLYFCGVDNSHDLFRSPLSFYTKRRLFSPSDPVRLWPMRPSIVALSLCYEFESKFSSTAISNNIFNTII